MAAPAKREASLPPPEQVDEYRLERPLGSGAMGQVYLAHDTLLDRRVAIKFVPAARPDGASRQRFLTEARAIARLHHPNVVSIYRIGEVAGWPYLVSEFVRGRVLAEVEKPLPAVLIVDIALGLSRGLGAAHRRGVLHRDLKPANVILAEDGEVKLLDFGLAKLFSGRSARPDARPDRVHPEPPPLRIPLMPSGSLDRTVSFEESPPRPIAAEADTAEHILPLHVTLSGTRLGTPLYMAPEIWRGEAATEQSDIYSLGAMLYELCTGQAPHSRCRLDELECAVEHGSIPPIATQVAACDPRLAEIIERCLQRDPTRRPDSAEMLCRMFEGLRAAASANTLPEGNPYRGLQQFEAEHRACFFGRSEEVRAILDLLRSEPLVLITGDSGLGKSSLCRAGILPAVSEGALGDGRFWQTAVLTPGRRPLQALAAALAPLLQVTAEQLLLLLQAEPESLPRALLIKLGQSDGLVLLCDQMEELITQSDVPEAVLFGEILGHLASRVPGIRVLATVRGDFLLRLIEATALSQELTQALYILRPLSGAALRESIVGPARLKGMSFASEAMIAEMVVGAEKAHGGLPLLQFALSALWEARDRSCGVISSDTLSGIGGVAGALAHYADGVLARLLPGERLAAQRLLTKLATLDGTRACRSETELVGSDPADRSALAALVRARLIVARQTDATGPSYEVAHEALLQGWSTLRGWLNRDAERRAVSERVESAALEWQRLNRSKETLFSAPQLAEVDATKLDPLGLSRTALDFLAVSRRHAGRRRLLRLIIAVGLCALPCVVVFAVLQWSRHIETEEIRAAESISAMARQPGRQIEALAEAVKLIGPALTGGGRPRPQAIMALTDAVMAGGPLLPPFHHDGPVRHVVFSPDDRFVLSASDDGTARIWSADDGRELHRLVGHQRTVHTAVYSPDGRRVLTASDDGTARLWDADSGALIARLDHQGPVYTALFSADGERIVTASADHSAALWDGHTGRLLSVLHGHSSAVRMATFSPDGRHLVTASADATAIIWDIATARAEHILTGHTKSVTIARYSPDGRWIVTGSDDFTARVFDAGTGQGVAVFREHKSEVGSAEFLPDSTRILSSAVDDVAARIWHAQTGVGLSWLKGHTRQLTYATASPDGTKFLTLGADHNIRQGNTSTGEGLAIYKSHTASVLHAAYAHKGQRFVSGGEDGRVQIWGEHITPIPSLQGHRGNVWDAAFSPDGKYVASASSDQSARIWDTHTGQMVANLLGHETVVHTVIFLSDGQRLATASWDGTVRLWAVPSGQSLAVMRGHTAKIRQLTLSSDGRTLVTAGDDQTVRLWNATSGDLLGVLHGHRGSVWAAAVSPNGEHLVSAGDDRVVRVWDVRTQKLLVTLSGHAGRVLYASYSPSGATLVTTSADQTAILWDASSLKPLATLHGHTDAVTWAGFAPDGSRLATVSGDGTAALWSVPSGRQLAILRGHTDMISNGAFSPNGQLLATGSHDRSVRVWDGRTGAPLSVYGGHLSSITHVAFAADGRSIVSASTDHTLSIFPTDVGFMLNAACQHLRRWPEHPYPQYCP